MGFKNILSVLLLSGAATIANADICNINPGSTTCGKGVVDNLQGNGMVSVNGTTIKGSTIVNGMITADDANFNSITINGSAIFYKCSINSDAEVKGTLKASSSNFERTIELYSNFIRLINTVVKQNINIHHSEGLAQKLLLENNSKVSGDITFDDGNGTVFISSDSKIDGNVIGGKVVYK